MVEAVTVEVVVTTLETVVRAPATVVVLAAPCPASAVLEGVVVAVTVVSALDDSVDALETVLLLARPEAELDCWVDPVGTEVSVEVAIVVEAAYWLAEGDPSRPQTAREDVRTAITIREARIGPVLFKQRYLGSERAIFHKYFCPNDQSFQAPSPPWRPLEG